MKGIDVFSAVEDNDVAKVVGILETFDFKKDGTNLQFTAESRNIMTLILGSASAVAAGSATGRIEYDLATELIERTAKVVDVFKFLKFVATAMRLGNDNYDIIPDSVRSALTKNNPSYAVNRVIDDMTPDAFEAMVSMLLSNRIAELGVSFNLPIIRYIYENQVISDDLLFAFMAACPRRTIEEFLSSINPLEVLAMLHLGKPKTGDEDDDNGAKAADETSDDHSGGGWAL